MAMVSKADCKKVHLMKDTADNQTEEIIRAFSKVRGATFKQIAESFGFENSGACKRWLDGQVRAGVLEVANHFVSPLPDLSTPLLEWAPGDNSPADFESVAYQCRKRLDGQAFEVAIYCLSQKAANALGVWVAKIAPGQATHDLAVTQVYLNHFLKNNAWQLEDENRGEGKRPDATITNEAGQTVAIEFAGKYSATRLAAFHGACKASGTPYLMY